MKLPKISRRTMLAAGGAAAGAGALGAVWFAASNPVDLIISLLQRALPGVRLDPVSVRTCAEDVFESVQYQFPRPQRLPSALKLKAVRMASQVAGVERVASMGPFEQRLDEITRVAVTRLLTNSNFFTVADPHSEVIVYTRPEPNAACGNPFADLTPPA